MYEEIEPTQGDRPKSVTVMSWLLIALSAIGWIGIMAMFAYISNQSNVKLQSPILFLVMPTLSAGLQVLAAAGMLRGRAWARSLFFYVVPLSIVVGIALNGFGGTGPGVIFKIVWYSIFVYFLTRPDVSRFFGVPTEKAPGTQQ